MIDTLRSRVAAHIPDGTPEIRYVEAYYFRCDCRRTSKRLRCAPSRWSTQTHRRRRIPVLDADGLECGYRLAGAETPRDERWEQLPAEIRPPGEVVAHPKPWLGEEADDEDESGGEGDYCWNCAVKLWESAMRMKWSARSHYSDGACDPIRSNDSSTPGGCCVCGVRFDGDPEDLEQEIAHWQENLPDCPSDWQELDRVLELLPERGQVDGDEESGDELLARISRVIDAAEQHEAIQDPIARLIHRWTWSPARDPFYTARAAELTGDLDAVLDAWQAERVRLVTIQRKYEGRGSSALTPEEYAERLQAANSWGWACAISSLRTALGLPAPAHPRTRCSHLPPPEDPAVLIEALAAKYYRGSFAELPKRDAKVGKRRGSNVEISGEYSAAERARHVALCALKSARWQHLLRRLGIDVARRWVESLEATATRWDATAARELAHISEQSTPGFWERYVTESHRQAGVARQWAMELEAWIKQQDCR